MSSVEYACLPVVARKKYHQCNHSLNVTGVVTKAVFTLAILFSATVSKSVWVSICQNSIIDISVTPVTFTGLRMIPLQVLEYGWLDLVYGRIKSPHKRKLWVSPYIIVSYSNSCNALCRNLSQEGEGNT